MNGVTSWLYAKPLASRKALLGATLAGAVALTVVLGFFSLPAVAQSFLGGSAGGVMYGVAVLFYQTVFSEQRQARWDLKVRYPLPGRRYKVFIVAAVWIIAVLALGRFTPTATDPLVGAINVAVLLSLYFLLRRSPIEEIDAVIAGELPLPTEDELDEGLGEDLDEDLDGDLSEPVNDNR